MPERSLQSRDRLMALLDVEGISTQEIATFVGVSTAYVYQVRKSPLYQVQVEDLRERLYAKRIDRMNELVDRIHGEAATSIDKILEIRDNGPGNVPPAVQLAAAAQIVDRSVPRKQDSERVEQRQVVIIGDEAVRRMAAVLAEAGIKPSERKSPRRIEEYVEETRQIENDLAETP